MTDDSHVTIDGEEQEMSDAIEHLHEEITEIHHRLQQPAAEDSETTDRRFNAPSTQTSDSARGSASHEQTTPETDSDSQTSDAVSTESAASGVAGDLNDDPRGTSAESGPLSEGTASERNSADDEAPGTTATKADEMTESVGTPHSEERTSQQDDTGQQSATSGELDEPSDADLETLFATVEQFVATAEIFESQIQALQDQVDSHGGRMAAIETASADVTDRLRDIMQIMQAQEDRLSTVESQSTDAENAVTDLQETVQGNVEDIADVRENNVTIRENLTDIRDELIDVQDELSALHSTNQSIQDDVDELRDADANLRETVASLQTTDDELFELLDELESNIVALENQSVELDGQDLLIRAAIRQLNREQLSEDDVRAVAEEVIGEYSEDFAERFDQIRSLLSTLHNRESTKVDIVGEIEALRSELEGMKQETGPVPSGPEEPRQPDSDELRENVRELERENRVIKELVEDLRDEA